MGKPTKEELSAARAARDAKVPVIQGKTIHWIPSEASLRAHEAKLKELQVLLKKGETAKERNTVRGEIRLTKAHLARKTVPSGKKGWTTERIATKHAFIVVFVSPKGYRYVLAERDGPADLLIVPAKKRARRTTPFLRLQRLEHSHHMKQLKRQQKEDATHTKRRKHKSAHRKQKRLMKRRAP